MNCIECVTGSGDDTREWGPPFVGEESAYFLSVNRNKKVYSILFIFCQFSTFKMHEIIVIVISFSQSIAVNLKDPKGTKLVTEVKVRHSVFLFFDALTYHLLLDIFWLEHLVSRTALSLLSACQSL